MLTEAFDYHLPSELIAQEPAEPRDSSRLFVLHRDEERFEHRHFYDLPGYLRPGDVLVVNRSRVIPARFYAHKVPTGGKVELLLLAKRGSRRWESLVKGRKVGVGQRLEIGEEDDTLRGTVEAVTEAGGRLIYFDEPVEPYMEHVGVIPLPPYIHKKPPDVERYQTVYAKAEGSVAAPTAGLHFTPRLIEDIRNLGVEWLSVTLHIGLDTFQPVRSETVEAHQIHTEYCCLPPETAKRINRAKAEGRRIIAVGTTTVRVLESAAQDRDFGVGPWDGPTDLYIYPGYRFRVIDALITNFHLPRSSLLMLVAAFANLKLIKKAYEEAVARRYRFYSFGDSMLIL
ncbi:MAG: tRNA preQ1(34) S-adenosylmethionine ribosyltransferase-isomerase QueA [Chloroflexota bacterium]|nr:tRNA preQ1(34) S-adenosylmethionine ribosyltransferase-isomerase QueA [Chloroflexota bacterium]